MWELDDLQLPQIRGIFREEMEAIELNAYRKGESPRTLMERAGKAVAQYINEHFTGKVAGHIVIFISAGNNGGDGLVIPRFLENPGKITLIQTRNKPMTSEEAKAMFELLHGWSEENSEKIDRFVYTEDNETVEEYYTNWKAIDLADIESVLQEADLIIDSIFGFKITSAIRPPYDRILELFAGLKPFNEESLPQQRLDSIDHQALLDQDHLFLSVDIPSGLDSNTGQWHGSKFLPDLTLTFQYTFRGMERHHLPSALVDIGLEQDENYMTNELLFVTHMPKRDPYSHKGVNGRLMIIGGSDEYTGAPVLSSMAGLRMGIDTVRTAVPETIRDIVAGYSKDFLIVKTKGDYHSPKNTKFLVDLATRRHQTTVIGPGMSNKSDCLKFAREFISRAHQKNALVVDADAIRAFRGHTGLLHNTNAIITPHKAELRYLLNEELPSEPQELLEFVEMKARQLHVTIVLKGKTDIITNGYRTFLNHTGHAGMTVGGTGDVLAGVIGSMACFVRVPFFAAVLGTYVMGLAGEAAAEKYGYSLLASDIIEELPGVLMRLQKVQDEVYH